MSKLFSSVAPLSYALDFHLERHNLLAANLANVDTPRYKPLDLARVGNDGQGSFEQAMQVALSRTNENHMQIAGADPASMADAARTLPRCIVRFSTGW